MYIYKLENYVILPNIVMPENLKYLRLIFFDSDITKKYLTMFGKKNLVVTWLT